MKPTAERLARLRTIATAQNAETHLLLGSSGRGLVYLTREGGIWWAGKLFSHPQLSVARATREARARQPKETTDAPQN